MQNVMVWIQPKDNIGYKWRYLDDRERIYNYLKLQVENSLYFGWDKKDVIIITNFPFEYMGIKSYIFKDDICGWSAFANKLVCVDKIIKENIINDDMWLHDVDAYQLINFDFPITCKDFGFTKHDPQRLKQQGGSGFFRRSSFDIIDVFSKLIKISKPQKEESFLPLFFIKGYEKLKDDVGVKLDNLKEKLIMANNKRNIEKLKGYINAVEIEKQYLSPYYGRFSDRFSYLDYSYNLSIVKYFKKKYPQSVLPVKVVHFHAEYPGCLDCYIRGKNIFNAKISTPFLDELLLKYKIIDSL